MKRWANRISSFLLIICLIVISFPTSAHDDDRKDVSIRTITKESFPGAAKFDRQAAYTYSQSAIGKKLGVFRDYPVSKGCTSPFAPIWIEEMVRRQS